MFILAYEFFVLGKAADVGSYAPVLLIAVSTVSSRFWVCVALRPRRRRRPRVQLIAGWDSLSSEISGYLITSALRAPATKGLLVRPPCAVACSAQ